MRPTLHLTAIVAAALGLAALAPSRAATADVPLSPRPAPLDGNRCEVWQVDYRLTDGTRFKVTDTVMKAGDGTYDVGPGQVTLRFRDVDGKPGPGTAELLSMKVVTKFTVESNVLGVKTKVTTDAVSKNTPGKCGVVATGRLAGKKLTWSGAASGYRSDGKLYCEGVMCGKMGAPPKGESPVKIGPYPVNYKPFVFANGVQKFMMPYAQVAKDDKPKQTTYLQMVGVETSRKCLPRPACK